MKRVLIIEDDTAIRDNLMELLDAEGYDAVGAPNGKAGIAQALRRRPDVVLCDIMMPVMDGHEVLRRLRDFPDTADVPFIFLTARAQRSDRREGMRLGADDYLTKPYERHEVLDAIAARLTRFAQAPSSPSQSSPSDSEPIVLSPALRAVYDKARQAAKSPISILLLGETGVGKDVLAQAIHKASPRASGPFVPLYCASLASSLLESELFGHERGAFTGAVQSREGLFETAEGGTVFLDEIGELPGEAQVKLLRVLQDRTVQRVGGRSARVVDVRFVAATNRDLASEVSAGTFREDLYYRLAGIVLQVPPLRERLDEIQPLAERFARSFSRQCGRARPPTLSGEVLDRLTAYAWPGNVRELRNVVEQAVALCPGDEIGEGQLAADLLTADLLSAAAGATGLRQEVAALERRRIEDALEAHGGNQTRAAAALHISRRTLLNRLDAFGLQRPRKAKPEE